MATVIVEREGKEDDEFTGEVWFECQGELLAIMCCTQSPVAVCAYYAGCWSKVYLKEDDS